MNINLHNYEEYFLLYADKELSREERKEVEEFIQQYPELEEEFEMINSSILEPETIELKDKSFLLKSSNTDFINKVNYEEIFVLYHDGELNAEQKRQADHFLNENPELKGEFILFSQAKMQPDVVSYPDKKSLLRKEPSGMTGRIILFRSLAAAVVLGFGFWITASYFSGNDVQNPIAQAVPLPVNSGQKTAIPTPGDPVKNEVAINEQTNKMTELQPEKGEANLAVVPANDKNGAKNKQEIILAKNNQNTVYAIQPEMNIQPGAKNEKTKELNDVMVAQIPSREITAGESFDRNELAHVDIDITPEVAENNYPVRNVVHLDVNKESSGNYILNVPEEEFRKTKIGGFLKQLKRVVDRNDPIKRLFEGPEGQVASNN